MKHTKLITSQKSLLFNARFIYGEAPGPLSHAVVEVAQKIDKELAISSPFEMEEWRELVKEVAEYLGIKDLAKAVKAKAGEIIQSKIDSRPPLRDAAILVQNTLLEVRAFLQNLKTRIFAAKARYLITESYEIRHNVQSGTELAEAAGAATEHVALGVKRAGRVTEGVMMAQKTVASGTKVSKEGIKVAELINEGAITPVEAYKIGLKTPMAMSEEGAKVAELVKKGVITAEDATRIGLKVEHVRYVPGILQKLGIGLETAQKLSTIAHIGGRIIVVVDLAVSIYDVYDQAMKLRQMLASDYHGSILEAVKSEVGHTPNMEHERSARRDSEEKQKLEETDRAKKLVNARNLGVNLVADAATFAATSVDATKRSRFESVEHGIGSVLSAPTEGLAGLIFGGSPEEQRLTAEAKTIQRSLGNAEAMFAQLSAMPRTPEVEKTGAALMAAINLAKKTVQTRKTASAAEVSEVTMMIRNARPPKSPPQLPNT